MGDPWRDGKIGKAMEPVLAVADNLARTTALNAWLRATIGLLIVANTVVILRLIGLA